MGSTGEVRENEKGPVSSSLSFPLPSFLEEEARFLHLVRGLQS